MNETSFECYLLFVLATKDWNMLAPQWLNPSPAEPGYTPPLQTVFVIKYVNLIK